MPAYRRRYTRSTRVKRRRYSRKPTRRSKRKRSHLARVVKRTKYGRTGRFTNLVQRIPPNAITTFSKRFNIAGQLFRNLDGATAQQADSKNYVVRANDIVNPCCIAGDDVDSAGNNQWDTNFTSALRTSVLGLNRIAPMYKEHVVQAFKYKIGLQYRCPNASSTANLKFFMCWRITDDPPLDVDKTNSTSADILNNVIHGRQTGWRYKLLPLANDRMLRKRITGTIPIRKFYRYPLFTRDEQQKQTCKTPDATPANWTSPENPCYFQFMLVCYDGGSSSEARVPDYIDGGTAATASGHTTKAYTNSWIIPYQLEANLQFVTRSTERDSDIVITSTTTDGGDDAENEDPVEDITATWVAHADDE